MMASAVALPARAFSGSYSPEDVTFLLKPVSLLPTDILHKEKAIQSGRRHYSEMLSAEAVPDAAYLELFEAALRRNSARLAHDVARLADAIAAAARPGQEIVLVSLARAGTPIGILLRRSLRRRGIAAVHYSVSIIRDRGIDMAALGWIAERHDPASAVFVDGWTGKGAIAGELHRSLADRPFGFVPRLAVIADPAGRADLAATEEDYLIPSGLLNAVVSGLVSRSILNDELVAPGDFHACVSYAEFASIDRSRPFVDAIDAAHPHVAPALFSRSADARKATARRCDKVIGEIMAVWNVRDRNRIKPGIAEATRVFLRRVPERLLLRDPGEPDVAHLLHLARRGNVAIARMPAASPFQAAVIIRALATEEEGQ
ncbi:cysteine protease StiP domain-containing protein [Allosphingosinicella deserti]|uniref:Uncharacterized protein n=1 Tax=Allosphingosinicella deserti TaxID=2116704 RepID=A0A2P7QNG7_9SPHN|nr:cysteine protease StiP domain-containing protein [Sphingomonas deserti]PSJ39519.1 hypothetical protein C7I55_13005 [Sphingomonas deserti]